MDERTHKIFLDDLAWSEPARFKTGAYLRGKGHKVYIPPITRAERWQDWPEHSDKGDLFVWFSHAPRIVQRVESKRLRSDFTNLADWPYKDFIVTSQGSYDRSVEKPYCFYITNPDMTHYGIVDCCSTFDLWKTGKRKDRRLKDDDEAGKDYYFCPLNLVHFHEFGEVTNIPTEADPFPPPPPAPFSTGRPISPRNRP